MMQATSDALLVTAARGGDSAAYGELFGRYQSRIYNYAYGIAGNRDDAADIAQEAFARVFEALPRLTGEVNFSAYVYRTTHNIAIDTVKGRGRFDAPEALDVQIEPSLRADPERVALVQEQQQQAWQAAFRLSDDHRAILTLRELHDLSYQEIAEIMDMPRNTVGVLLSRARLRFKEAFRMSSVDIDKLTAECQDMLPLLSAYIDDELDDARRAKVESHVEQCAFCRLALEEMTESSRSYRAILPLLVPAGLGEALWLRLGEGTASAHPASPDGAASSEQAASFEPAPTPDPTPTSGGFGGAGGADPGFMVRSGAPAPQPKGAYRDPIRRQLTLVAFGAVVVLAFGALLAAGAFDRRDDPGPDGTVVVSTTTTLPLADIVAVDIATDLTASTVTTWPMTTTSVTTWPITTTSVTARPATTTSVTQAPDTAAPPTPPIVYPTAGTVVEATAVILQWKPVRDASGVTYRVEVQSFDDKAGKYVVTDWADGIRATEFRHTIVSTRERWRVTAIDGAGNASAPSDWAKYAQSSPTTTTSIILY